MDVGLWKYKIGYRPLVYIVHVEKEQTEKIYIEDKQLERPRKCPFKHLLDL